MNWAKPANFREIEVSGFFRSANALSIVLMTGESTAEWVDEIEVLILHTDNPALRKRAEQFLDGYHNDAAGKIRRLLTFDGIPSIVGGDPSFSIHALSPVGVKSIVGAPIGLSFFRMLDAHNDNTRCGG